MDAELIKYLKDFLSENRIDGLIINSTNGFLVEYNKQELCSRYYVTDFTGSTGDVLFTNDKIYLFVDTRYHEQADNEVDKNFIEVVKRPLNQSYLAALKEKIPPYFKVGIISQKTSKRFYDDFAKEVSAKNVTIKTFDFDPVEEYEKDKVSPVNYTVFKVPDEISGMSADEKYNLIKSYAEGNEFFVIVTSLEDVAYLTNMRSYDFDYSATFPAKAIISDKETVVYTDCEVGYIGENYKVLPLNEFETALRSIKNKVLYIDEKTMNLHDFNLINKTVKTEESRLNLFKTVKNEKEIEHLKECYKRSDAALSPIYDMLNSETVYTEYDYYEALCESMKKEGARSLSFKPIVAGGSNSSIIHYSTPSKTKKIKKGDFLLIDYGGYYEGGYATDTTRTFIKGIPTKEQKSAYTTVLKAFLNAYFKEYDKKSSYFDIDKTARDIINKNAEEGYEFAHGTGHGTGICVHENPPILSDKQVSRTKILENTVFSVEPGAYKANKGGIRLESTVYAKQEGDKIKLHSFTRLPFEVKAVDLSMMNDYEKYYYMKWQADACPE